MRRPATIPNDPYGWAGAGGQITAAKHVVHITSGRGTGRPVRAWEADMSAQRGLVSGA